MPKKNFFPKIGIGFDCLILCLSFSISLFLVACNKSVDPDIDAPTSKVNLLSSQGSFRFGITDSISIEFSEKIDTAALALAFTPSEGIGYKFFDDKKLLIFGKNKIFGKNSFNINSPFTLAMTGLRDLAGNGQSRIENKFLSYPWVDQETIDTNFVGADSLFKDSTTWIDGSPITDSIVTEGSLSFPNNLSRLDWQDFKIIEMKAPDTLTLLLTTAKELDIKLQIAGPFAPANIQSTFKNYDFDSSFYMGQTGDRGQVATQVVAKYEDHDRKFGSPSMPGIYAIRLSIPANQKGFYRLALKMKKFKR